MEATRTRRLPLEGGRNFRDLGGYATEDGRRVRWGQLFRSGSLAALTANDHGTLAALGIRTICDLRTTDERSAAPTTWTPPSVRILAWDYDLDRGAVMGAFRLGTPSPEGVREAISTFYRTAPGDFAERFATLFGLLIEGEAPLTVHCTAGKDRTGVAAALLLRALGVPRTAVVEDYALSGLAANDEQLTRRGSRERSSSWAFLAELPMELRAPLVASDPYYIEATLDQVDRDYGSIEAYLSQRLGIEGGALARLRDRYLEP